jgi:ornithine--oxo-acid transaminase
MNEKHASVASAERFGARNYAPLPVVITDGSGAWVSDTDGRRYLDCISAYSSVNQGHCHPRIVEALTTQATRLTLTSRAVHNDRMGAFLQRLCELAEFDKALPMNTGAEAVETAIKLARKWGYRHRKVPADHARIVVCANNFHGRTTTIVGFSTEARYRDDFGPFDGGFDIVPFDDAGALDAAITDDTVAFLVEPIQAEAGVRVPSEGYLDEAREICSRHGILLMLDEIQTGLARTGRMFAFQHGRHSRPDVLILGKALGGGIYPVSAVLASAELMNVFGPGDHGSTFGGNPLASAVAQASLDVIVDEDLASRAADLGRRLRDGLALIDSPVVTDVRGKGLLLGLEFAAAAGPARAWAEKLLAAGVLAKDTHRQVLRLAPPLVVTAEEIDWLLERLRAVLR